MLTISVLVHNVDAWKLFISGLIKRY